MLVRRMEEKDLPWVAELEQKNFTQPWSQKAFCDSLSMEEACFWIAEEDGKGVGYIGVYFSLDEGEITNVSVSSDCRNQGIGTALVQQLKQEAGIRKVTKIFLEVRVSNASAIHLYQKEGFETVGCRKGFYENPKEDAWIMKCDL